jgi:hypothetical protein
MSKIQTRRLFQLLTARGRNFGSVRYPTRGYGFVAKNTTRCAFSTDPVMLYVQELLG